jgi:hypothetical protein
VDPTQAVEKGRVLGIERNRAGDQRDISRSAHM